MNAAISTGLPTLDHLLGGGPRPGTLTVVAGHSQSGMTTFLDAVTCWSAFGLDVPTVLADLETSPAERLCRLLSNLSAVPLTRVQRGALTGEEQAAIRRSARFTGSAPFWFADDEGTTAGLVRAARRHNPPARLLVVDGMRYLPSDTPGQAAADLAAVAARTGLAVLASQPLRHDADRSAPTVDHLPAGVAQAADAVVLLHRADPASDSTRVDVTVGFARHGHTGRVPMIADFSRARMADLATELAL